MADQSVIGKLAEEADKTALLEQLIDMWDVDGRFDDPPALMTELDRFTQTNPDLARRIAVRDRLCGALIELGEALPDMYWARVSVVCRELIDYGLMEGFDAC